MREALAIKEEFYSKWISPNGLALLGIGHDENDNGILFYAYFIALCRKLGILDDRDKAHALALLKDLQERPGLLNRRVGDNAKLEAHDNYVGAMYLAKVFGDEAFIKDCVDYGVSNGWNYNNIPPYEWRLESQRQGGDIALYTLVYANRADILNYLWLVVGVLISAHRWSSQVLLSWLRCQALESGFINLLGTLFISDSKLQLNLERYFGVDSIYARMGRLANGIKGS